MFKDRHGRHLTMEEVFIKVMNRFYNYWLDFVLMVLTCVGFVPLHSVRLLAYRLAGVRIGRGSRIHVGCRFYQPTGVSIGKDTIIGNNAFLDGRAQLQIGNHVAIASEVMIYNAQHDIDSEDFHADERPVKIEDYVFIGPRAIILPGVTIGYGAVIAAGAVVTKDVTPRTVVGGVPAEVIRERKGEQFSYRLGRARLFQ